MNNIFISGGNFDVQSLGSCVLPDTVPKGKQLVLETVTGFYVGEGALIGAAYLTVGGYYQFAFPWVQCSAPGATFADSRWYGFNHNVRIYINGPATLQFDADGSLTGGVPSGHISLTGSYAVSGHLVDI